MRVTLGLGLEGPVYRAFEGDRPSAIAEHVFGPSGLRRDLELRLGLPQIADSTAARLPRWIARIKSLADTHAFYARSFGVDEIGTAEVLLAWRDGLVEAGWDGSPVRDGGDRLEALAALEQRDLAPGPVDRLVRIATALRETPSPIYESLSLADDRCLWPHVWRRIFDGLEERGTKLRGRAVELPGAPPECDLGLLQRHLRGDDASRARQVRGDGSLFLIRGDTPAELAELTVALLRSSGGDRPNAVIVRPRHLAPLEAALQRHGLSRQGDARASVCRPSLQVLPLAIELAFEPIDPHRLLELLTLPRGPFHGALGGLLARAVSRQPGIGGQEWNRRKALVAERLEESHLKLQLEQGAPEGTARARARKYVAESMARVSEWLEASRSPREGATKHQLIEVAERVRRWMLARIALGEAEPFGAGHAQAQAFVDALAQDTRDRLTLDEARQVLDRLARTARLHELTMEEEGRIPHVSHPSALLGACGTCVLWIFVSGTERSPPLAPWNRDELFTLETAGVHFVDPVRLLEAEAQAWRRAISSATERVWLVVPRTVAGQPVAPHPLWDEIAAKLVPDDAALQRIALDATALLARAAAGPAPVANVPALALPEPRGAWALPPDAVAPREDASFAVTALESLVTCPLAWVLEHRAKLSTGAVAKVASGPLLNGTLGHRLVEELHRGGAFVLDADAFRTHARAILETLIRAEGASLLLPGAAFERAQLVRQLLLAMRELHRWLAISGYAVVAVEEEVEVCSAIGKLRGRLDVRLGDRSGRTAVLDLKWGSSSYRDRLRDGRALQLAAYQRVFGGAAAGYFSLSSAQVLSADARMKAERTISGPSLDSTWQRAERTAAAVLMRHEAGHVAVTGTRRALTLLDALDVPEADRDLHHRCEPDCGGCAYGGICGRAWEGL